ncbi:MAG: hypothetical protein U5Q44_10260 [Dehalococcoidia bacterium]|nr:hypothetical protein [Dehalococcoidia bacterium]
MKRDALDPLHPVEAAVIRHHQPDGRAMAVGKRFSVYSQREYGQFGFRHGEPAASR